MRQQQQQNPDDGSISAGGVAIPTAGGEGRLFDIKKWGGINTRADRTAIEDNQFSWLENLMPIGDGNLRTLYREQTPIYTAPGGKTIILHFPFNIGATPFIAVFLSDGTADQVDMNGVITHISLAANLLYNGGNPPGVTQWGSSGIVMVATTSANAYFAWDGTTFFKPGDPAPSWLSGLAAPLTFTGNTHSNTTVDTLVPNTTFVVDGMLITGTDIPGSTTIVSHTATAFVISQNATGTHAGNFTVQFFMPNGVAGTAIEIYQNRVWIDNGTNLLTSAPSNGCRFDGALGGVVTPSTDSFLRVKYTSIRQANGFLYSFGDSSVNVISNVQTSGSPLLTTFNNFNVDPQVGTTWPGTVHEFGTGLIFANPIGVYELKGGAATKISDDLDGIFADADFSTLIPSGASCAIFGIKVYILLLRSADLTNVVRNFLCIWDGKKWFVGSQVATLTYIETQEINSVITCWGTNGTTLFKMFQTPSTSLNKIIQTKLWQGQTYLIVKQSMRLFTLGTDNSTSGYSFTGTIDQVTESGRTSVSVSLSASPALITWINNTSGVIQFQNNLSQNINWTTVGAQSILGTDAKGIAPLLGLTLQSSSSDFTLSALSLLYDRLAPVGG